MKELSLVPNTPEWVAARFNYDCASEAPVAMGASKHMTRNEFIRLKATGGGKEFSQYVLEKVLAKGHHLEALARPLVEKAIGKALYPVVITDDSGQYLASLDGKPMYGGPIMEHKGWNDWVAAQVKAKELDPHFYWQLEHILLCAVDADEPVDSIVFVTSDGTENNLEMMEYRSIPERRAQLIAGWEQFHKDVAAYVHVEPVVEAVGKKPEQLPMLVVQVEGKVLSSNLETVEVAVSRLVEASTSMKLITDQDFADATQLIKWCEAGERALEAEKERALSQTQDLKLLFDRIDAVQETLRKKLRLPFNTKVEARKVARRVEIIQRGKDAWQDYLAECNKTIGKNYMPTIQGVDFPGQISGKKSFDSMNNAVDTHLATLKIEANRIRDLIIANMAMLRELVPKQHLGLFARDTDQLVLKPTDDCRAIAEGRIAAQKKIDDEAAEALRLKTIEDEAERIAEAARQKLAADPPAPSPTPAPAAASSVVSQGSGRIGGGATRFIMGGMPDGDHRGSVDVVDCRPDRGPAAGYPEHDIDGGVPVFNPDRRVKLVDIEKVLGFHVTAEYLLSLGITAVGRERTASLYLEAQVPKICDAIIKRVTEAKREFIEFNATSTT